MYGFWSALTGLYYGTPSGRRIAPIQSATWLGNARSPGIAGAPPHCRGISDRTSRSSGSLSHVQNLPDVTAHFPIIRMEALLADAGISGRVLNQQMTFAEDRQLRDLAKKLADLNPDLKKTNIALPSGFAIELDPSRDDKNIEPPHELHRLQ